MKLNKLTLFLTILVLSLVLAAAARIIQAKGMLLKRPMQEMIQQKCLLLKIVELEAENPSASPQLAINRGDTVVVGLQEPGGVFTPYFNTSGYDGNVQSVMFPPLVEINEAGEPIPGLAETWDVSEDGLAYTYQFA